MNLTGVKVKFTEITKEQISEFKTQLEKFSDKFREEGPGAVGSDLEKGLKILTDFKKELNQYEADRYGS